MSASIAYDPDPLLGRFEYLEKTFKEFSSYLVIMMSGMSDRLFEEFLD